MLLFKVRHRRQTIATGFTSPERDRFRNLLELAKSSKFDGERANAIAAATRLAEKYGMSLEDAARFQGEASQGPRSKSRHSRERSDPFGFPARATAADVSHTDHMAEEKERWETAVKEARVRGLDSEKKSQAEAARPKRSIRARRNPTSHATVLLKETGLSLHEIADISGLDIYSVVGVKLKLRNTML